MTGAASQRRHGVLGHAAAFISFGEKLIFVEESITTVKKSPVSKEGEREEKR